MSEKLQPLRGMQDVLPNEWSRMRWIEDQALAIGNLYGFSAMETPIMEATSLFHRGLGQTSDMVSKETYTFEDRSGDSVTLRPEGTAGLVRAFISNGLAQELPLKLMYMGPMFRHERPQKGRLRQFHQIGVESLGFADAWADFECIAFAHRLLEKLGLLGACSLKINTIGDVPSRMAHKQKFCEYLEPYRSELSSDSQIRLDKNPLRIFDSKDPKDQKLLENAPRLKDHLNDQSKDFYSKLLQCLIDARISFVETPELVRGIDYYTHTVFEFVTQRLGAQGAVISGGRYDGLVEEFGGNPTPGVGWGCGVERMLLLLQIQDQTESHKTNKISPVAVVTFEERFQGQALQICESIRAADLPCEYLGVGSLGKKLKRANKIGASQVCILGEDEMQKGMVTVKNMLDGSQKLIAFSQLTAELTG